MAFGGAKGNKRIRKRGFDFALSVHRRAKRKDFRAFPLGGENFIFEKRERADSFGDQGSHSGGLKERRSVEQFRLERLEGQNVMISFGGVLNFLLLFLLL